MWSVRDSNPQSHKDIWLEDRDASNYVLTDQIRARNLILQGAVSYLLNIYTYAFTIALYTTIINKVCDHGRIPTRNSFETRSVFWGGHAVTLYVAKKLYSGWDSNPRPTA